MPIHGATCVVAWYGEGKVAYQRDRMLPSGQSQLLINLGPSQQYVEG